MIMWEYVFCPATSSARSSILHSWIRPPRIASMLCSFVQSASCSSLVFLRMRSTALAAQTPSRSSDGAPSAGRDWHTGLGGINCLKFSGSTSMTRSWYDRRTILPRTSRQNRFWQSVSGASSTWAHRSHGHWKL